MNSSFFGIVEIMPLPPPAPPPEAEGVDVIEVSEATLVYKLVASC